MEKTGITALDALLAMTDEDTLLVPGLGNVQWKWSEELNSMVLMLVDEENT